MNLRRIAIVPEMIVAMLSQQPDGDVFHVENGLPTDAILVGASFCADVNVFDLVFSHPSFPKVIPGASIPIEHVIFHRSKSPGVSGLMKSL